MTISVKCACGKKLMAPDEMRGRMARCPNCGKPLLVREEISLNPLNQRVGPLPPTGPEEAPRQENDDLQLDREELDQPTGGEQSEDESGGALRKCPNCNTVLKAGQVVCPGCGFSPQAAIFTGQQRSQDTTKAYGNLFGVDMTLAKWITLTVVVAIIVGAVSWYYVVGPGRKFRVLDTQLVTGFDALDAVSVLDPMNLGHLGGDPRLGMRLPAGAKGPGGAAVPTVEDPDITGLGGNDKLTLTRPDPSGNYLLIRAEINQSYLEDLGFQSRYDVVFRASAYKLVTNSGSVPGTLLAAELSSGSEINVAAGRTSDYKALYPTISKPSHQDLKFELNFPNAGEVTFDGSDAKGRFHFFAPAITAPGSSSLEVDGHLDVTSPQGMSVAYDYKGGAMTVGWSPGVTGWRSSGQYVKKEDFSPYHKWTITLLFARPAGADSGQITINDILVAKVSFPASAVSVAAMPGITVTAPPPPPPPSAAAGGSTTGGSATTHPSSVAALPSDPLSSYLGALAAARQKAKGVVSASNIQQLLYAIMLYAEQHSGKMPDKLDDLRGTIDGYDTIIKNPRTQEVPGFIYVKPADKYDQIKDPSFTPILYESDNGKADPKGDIGYADGHVTMGM